MHNVGDNGQSVEVVPPCGKAFVVTTDEQGPGSVGPVIRRGYCARPLAHDGACSGAVTEKEKAEPHRPWGRALERIIRKAGEEQAKTERELDDARGTLQDVYRVLLNARDCLGRVDTSAERSIARLNVESALDRVLDALGRIEACNQRFYDVTTDAHAGGGQ
jgi:hypothetical protein